jgi:2-polyprenyl-6-methoxyphenol hydroxylase-like FAD-dependent oxidoreductase
MAPQHSIAIIGGGLGGLTLALVLRQKGIDATVYELDASPSARRQGGMLDMHEESGQLALRASGLFDEFQKLVLEGGEATRVMDDSATILYEDDGTHGGRPEVDRGALRGIMLAALPADSIRWGAKVTGVRKLTDGRHEVSLADGTTFSADLIVGADGAWSRVRRALSTVIPEYLGLTFVEMNIDNAADEHPVAADVAGRGSLFALADGKGLLAHRGHDTLHVGAALRLPAARSGSNDIELGDPASARATLTREFAHWDARLLSLISESSGPFVPYPLHALPAGHAWEHEPGITLIGDAAHLMSPFAGEGANLAMLDATELAAAIAESPADPDAAIARYERAMFPRSEAAAAQSKAVLELCFGPGAASALADLMNSFGRQPE